MRTVPHGRDVTIELQPSLSLRFVRVLSLVLFSVESLGLHSHHLIIYTAMFMMFLCIRFIFNFHRLAFLTCFWTIRVYKKRVHHYKMGLTLEYECCLKQEADSSGKSMSLRLQAQAMPAESLPRRGKQPQVMVKSLKKGVFYKEEIELLALYRWL